MTYILSKLFWLVFRPLNLTFFLMLGGLLLRKTSAGRTNLHRAGAGLIGFSFLVVLLLGFTNIPDYMLYRLENQVVAGILPEKPAGIIVLGGGMDLRVARYRNLEYAIADGGDRLIAGFELSNKYPGIPLVYSGGPARRTADRVPETGIAKNIATALYGEGKSMIFENRSRNTWENAMFSKELLSSDPGSKWIIVTSAYHAARTSAIFDRVGFNFVIYPTDYRAEFSGKPELADNALKQFKKADLALKELTGILVYTLMGRIDWPF